MASFLVNPVLLLQPDPTNAVGSGTTSAPAAGGGKAPMGGCGAQDSTGLLMMAVMFGVFYFLLLRPQQKRQKELDSMLKSLRKGDKVRTSGGIRGEIAELTDSEVTLLIADKVKINVLRSHIAAKVDKPAADDKAKA